MFSSNEKPCDMSDKDSIVTRHVVLTAKRDVIDFGFIPYENHPLRKDKMMCVPRFAELRGSDRLDARTTFLSSYQKMEFSTFCAKASEGVERLSACITILTERGIWWGRAQSTDSSSGRNPVMLTESANELIEKYESDTKESGNPFGVLYSGLGMIPAERALKNFRIIACEFGGEWRIPLDHPFMKRHLRIVCCAQARSSTMEMAIVASIQQSELVRFASGDSPSFKELSPTSSYLLETISERHDKWRSLPRVNGKKLSPIG